MRQYPLARLIPDLNIVVGDNEAGKSTLVEAIHLGLTGRINGRWAVDDLNPYWFNQKAVTKFFAENNVEKTTVPPELLIELYFSNTDDSIQAMRGVHNSRREHAPGIALRVAPSPDYAVEFAEYLAAPNCHRVIPVEYYDVRWQDFSGGSLRRRPKELGVAVIDSRTIRSTAGIDYHTREILGDVITPKERAAISVAHRKARHDINTAIYWQSLRRQHARAATDQRSW
jgi:putative ATP-dependent endonuclease of the OLD family